MTLKRHQKILLWACVASLVVWIVPPLRWALLPLVFYNTHIHELAHALAAIGTGGSVDYIQVFSNGGGVTLTRGGSALLLSSAGYVGSAIVGGIILYGSRSTESARKMMFVAMAFLSLSMVFFVRGDGFGVGMGALWIIGLFFAGRHLKGDAAVFAAQFLGIQQCLTSAQAFVPLLIVASNGSVHNDAGNLQQVTGIPAVIWASLWLVISLGAIWIGLSRSWRERPR